MKISPLIGELVWNEAPSDELLSWQLAYFQFFENQWNSKLTDFRLGFTRMSLVWKNEQFHAAFIKSFSDFELMPLPLSENTWEIPVCYEPELAPDLFEFTERKQLTRSQLIEIHTSPSYRIHFFGFLPGFFYLNGLPEILHTPRKAIPNLTVSKGSVAIGGAQTGIYPWQSPGGWHIIGRTPISLFDPKNTPPVWAKPGEQIKFVPINFSQYKNWSFASPHLKKR